MLDGDDDKHPDDGSNAGHGSKADDGTDVDDTDNGGWRASASSESDSEAEIPDPETDLPNVPSVEIPTPGASETDVPGELLAGFWSTVLVFNVALLATSVGALLLVFRGPERLAAGALIVGALATAHGYWKYRRLSERQRSGEWGDESTADPPVERAGDDPDDGRNG